MPLNVNVGVAKKLGQPDFGSLGASCSIQVELPHDIIFCDLEAFHRQVRSVYAACAQAVNDELARQQGNGSTSQASNGANSHTQSSHNGSNGHGHATNGNGRSGQGSVASEKQIVYASQLAKSIQGLGIRGLEGLAQRMFGKPLVALTTLDASGLIDSLKAIKEGRIDISTVLNEPAA